MISKKKILQGEINEMAAMLTKKTVTAAQAFAIGAPAVIGAASLIDVYMNAEDRHRSYKQERIQERNLNQKMERQMKDQYLSLTDPSAHQGLVQQMFNQRIGHTNSWGGNKY